MTNNELFEHWYETNEAFKITRFELCKAACKFGYDAAMKEMSGMKAEVFIGFDHGYREFGESEAVLIGCTDIKALIHRPQIKG